MFLIFKSVHKNFVENLKIVVKNSEKLKCSYGKVSHDLKGSFLLCKIVQFLFQLESYFYICIINFMNELTLHIVSY